MARTGVLFEEVKQAAEALMSEGAHPTHAKIRAILGGGSFSTIGKHLQAWRESLRDTGQPTPPPEGLQAVVGQIWQELDAAAAERVAAAQREAEARIAQAAQAAEEQVAQARATAQREVDSAKAAQVAAQEDARREVAAAIDGWKACEAKLAAQQEAASEREEKLQAATHQNTRLATQLQACVTELENQRDAAARAAQAATVQFEQWRADLQRERAQCIEAAKQSAQAYDVLAGELEALRASTVRAAKEHAAAMHREQNVQQTHLRRAEAAEEQLVQVRAQFQTLQTTHDAALLALKAAQQGHTTLQSGFASLQHDMGALRQHLRERDEQVANRISAVVSAAEKRLADKLDTEA